MSDLRFEHVLDEIPENALTLGNLKSVILFFQSSLHFCRPYDIAIIYQERFIKRHLIERAGSQLKCVWSNAFKRSDRGISNSMKLVSNCRLFYADSSNCIGNIESIKHESYMDYGSNQMSPEIMFVDCVYKRKVLIQQQLNLLLNIFNLCYFRPGICEILQRTFATEETAIETAKSRGSY